MNDSDQNNNANMTTTRAPLSSMSEERQFMENLLCTRFNFFLVFVGFIFAGALTTTNIVLFRTVIWLGFVISVPFAMAIARAQLKLNIALNQFLFRDGSNNIHAAGILNKEATAQTEQFCWLLKIWTGSSRRNLIGYWIPAICCFTLLCGAILSLFVTIDLNGKLKWIGI